MNRFRILGIIAMGLWASYAQGALVPTPGALDARVRTAPYDPNQVYRLQGTLGYAIDLIVAPDEALIGLAGGELDAVVVAANAHRLTIKPTRAPLSTNFTLLTTLRAYHIEYSVSEPKDGGEPEIFSVQFTYAPASADQSPDDTIDRALDQTPPVVNSDYWYCGAGALQPVAASDDGLHTRLTFSPHTEWPAMYVLGADGAESLVNVSVQGNTAVIHRLFQRLILRRGNLVGCVVNRGAVRAQPAPPTGTVSPHVSRVLKGVKRILKRVKP